MRRSRGISAMRSCKWLSGIFTLPSICLVAHSQGGFMFASGLGDDHDGLGAIEYCTGPSGVLPAQSDIDAAGQVALGVLGGIPHIENLGAPVAHPKDFVK